MRLRHIEVFHAVYSSGSVTSAARLLNVSQPSISKVLAHAESQLGFPLFQRIKGKLVATPEAVRLYDSVAALYEDLTAVRRISANLRTAADGRIRVACTPAIGLELLPDAIASFRALEPEAVIEIETLHLAELTAALAESRIDLALAFDAPSVPGITGEILFHGAMVLIAPLDEPDLPAGPVMLADLDGRPFIRLNERGPLGQLLTSHLAASEVHLQEVAVCETYQIARRLVAQGLGLSVVDQLTAHGAAGGDVRVLPFEPEIPFSVDLLTLENRPLTLLCQRFADHLRPAFAARSGLGNT
jgi:DNA-binding transcriptional LysR family regulator